MTFKKFPKWHGEAIDMVPNEEIERYIAEVEMFRMDLVKQLRELFDTIPLDYQKIKDGYWEFYVLGTRSQWINWLSKFDQLLEALVRGLKTT